MEQSAPKFPFRKNCPFSPPPEVDQLRFEAPVAKVELFDGSQAWLLTRYDDVRAVLGDARFSVDPARKNYPFPFASRKADVQFKPRSFLFMDPPEHGRLRRMLTREFTVKRMNDMRPQIQGIVDDLIGRLTLKGPPADILSEFAIVLPSLVITEMLGVPYQDHDLFQTTTKARLDGGGDPKKAIEASAQIYGYLEQLIQGKLDKSDSGDDLLGRLVAAYVKTGQLSVAEATSMADLLLLAGHETSGNSIAMSLLVLLQNPAEKQRLIEDPSLMPQAVEELLRFLTPTQTHSHRTATADVEVGGKTIKAGDGVIAMIMAANWDPDVYPCPERLDLTRDAGQHLAFSYGIHQCLGQPLARLEMEIALASLLTRLPDLRLAVPLEDIPFRADGVVYGPKALPMAW